MALTRRTSSSSKGIVIILFVVAALAIGWLLVWPQYGRLKDAGESFDAAAALYDTKTKLVADIEDLLSTYNANKEGFDLLKPALPTAPEVPQLLATLEKLAADNRFSVSEIKITDGSVVEQTGAPLTPSGMPAQPPANSGLLKKEIIPLQIELNVSGAFQDFPFFLAALEKNIRLFEIDLISTENQSSGAALPEGQAESIPSFRFVMSAYYLK